jgi:hypothetical protein
MALSEVRDQLDAELEALSNYFRDFAARKSILNSAAHFSFLDECVLEGLLSRAWQAWGDFCRSCVVDSCMGTHTSSGTRINAVPEAFTAAHVSGAAIRAKKSQAPYWGSPNELLRTEPTWGDVDVLTKILPRLAPANSGQLLAAFSSAHPSVRALQAIRNCAAHNHVQNLKEVESLRSAYVVFPVVHPTHAMYWIEPKSTDYLITKAIDELKEAAAIATS